MTIVNINLSRSLFIGILPLFIFLTSCQKIDEVDAPEACFEILKLDAATKTLVPVTTAKKNEEITFRACSLANQQVVWAGETGISDLNGDNKNKGTIISPESKTAVYTYKTAGTYTVTFIATNIVYANNGKQTKSTKTITIVD